MKALLPILCALLTFLSPSVSAQSPGNPNATMTAVGPSTVLVAPGEVIPQNFAVRVIDTAGHPIQGVSVWYFVNSISAPPEAPDPSPPPGTYGSFAWPAEALLAVRTDSNGIATAPAFTAGILGGYYDVAAGVYPAFDPQTLALIGSDSMDVLFHVQQVAGGGLQAPFSAPTLSPAALVLLTALLGLLGVRRRRSSASAR
jgi:hypothetical protein